MFKKSFVSIYFSSNEVRVVQLTSNKRKIKVSTTVQIPEGIITERSVTDKDALAALLQKIWSKLKIKEKSVGIVIPEFSTFTKALDVPEVENDELDEAVRWQAQEFLPWQEEDTILDWKIIQKKEKSYQILFVAVKKKVLFGYVKAISKAGLFPIVVETPSLSLVRLSGTGDVGKLIFYGGKHSSIFILTKGDRILASSVSYSNEKEYLLTTSKTIASHFKDTKIESIEVDGPGVTMEFSKELSEIFGQKVKLLGKEMSGISKEMMGQYLIPISLLLKDPSEPADTTTVNLLPLHWVRKYELRKLRVQVWSLNLMVSYMVWLAFFAALASYLFFGQLINQLQSDNSLSGGLNPGELDVIKEVQATNALADKVIRISDATVLPQTVLNTIYSVRPEAVSIIRYKIDMDSGVIDLFGVSADRVSLISFKQSVEEQEEFSLVDIPIASLEVERDLEFSMSFNYLPVSAERKGLFENN